MYKRFFLAVLLGASLWAQAPEGIPRELARQRAHQLKSVRYQISYTIAPQAASIAGHQELRFEQSADELGIVSQFLDFREGTVSSLSINGQTAPTAIHNGHIELPGELLRVGENLVTIDFTAPVAPAGKALTRFEDKDDGSEYIYTLFVPMDASMAFPCFDQPDLKAKFHLTIVAPGSWTVVSNSPVVGTTPIAGGTKRTEFAETKPISTYLFAFAAGPFKKVHDLPGLPGIYVRQSKLKRAEEEAAEVQEITAQGIDYLSGFFAQPFPFRKYDLVLIPGFAYGGMEHAGATFLREESVLFRTAPTHSDYLNRDILLLHETTHQWFGDLVTMRWFDDLWLKEGFAQYMAYDALAHLKPREDIWKRFYQAIKPAAYAIDSTRGTTPIYQDIANLKDAKSAYGAIVYSKAPGVIKQLAFVLGEAQFRDGLRLYLKEHAYANAEWSDLVSAFERVSGKQLGAWASIWIRTQGMSRVDSDWNCNPQKGSIDYFVLKQAHQGDVFDVVRPIAMQVLLRYADGHELHLRAQLNENRTDLDEAFGQACPLFVFANDQDYAYGRFLLDPRSRKAVMEQLGEIKDVFERTLLWGSLWDSVREAELDPRDYIELALRLLPTESDESIAQSIIASMTTALHRYVSPADRLELAAKVEALAYQKMVRSPERDMRIIWFRALRGAAETPGGRRHLKDLLSGQLVVPGVELRPQDRWNIVTSLVALNDPEAGALLAAEEKRDPSGDGRKYAYVAAAARPDGGVKKQYFDQYLRDA
ncbi:MAG TPA: M1 family aminopeptidase, partial [Terriglobales bacterium]